MMAGMLRVHRSPVEAYRDAYRLAVRYVPPIRWALHGLAGALLLPGTPAHAAASELPAAAWRA